jgi:hypothetical protein
VTESTQNVFDRAHNDCIASYHYRQAESDPLRYGTDKRLASRLLADGTSTSA